MTTTQGFLFFLLLTIALLVLVLITGFRAQRRRHLPLVAAAVLSLGMAIVYARRLVDLYDFEAAGRIYPIHMMVAKIATFSYVLPIGTGFLTLRDGKRRPLHRKFAFLVVGLTLLAAITGIWMIALAEKLPTG